MSISRIKARRIITPEGIISGYVYYENDKITYVGCDERPYDTEIDAGDLYVSPGFVDLHTHGAMGVDYCDITGAEELELALAYKASHGATTVLPTITSSSREKTLAALECFERIIGGTYSARVPGVHLEGPFFSCDFCGAQNPELITPPRVEFYGEILEKHGNIIKRWDYAPELDEGAVFCRALTERGIIASAGHTGAEYDDIVRAMGQGMNLITHLYSCTSTITRKGGFRHLGVIECAYLFDELYAEIIADGRHLPPELLRLIFKTKPHDKLILVTDSLCVAGVDRLESNVGGVKCIVEDGVCKLLDRSAFAGSIATMDRLVRVVTKEAGLPIEDAVMMAAYTPARLLKLNTGAIESGKDADIIFFDDQINVSRVIVAGRTIK
ncbi:MAG: amidohydrolase family protein [Clostridia bacterium]|nr:amidohydrolase family protein [Clostridia bacterium]